MKALFFAVLAYTVWTGMALLNQALEIIPHLTTIN